MPGLPGAQVTIVSTSGSGIWIPRDMFPTERKKVTTCINKAWAEKHWGKRYPLFNKDHAGGIRGDQDLLAFVDEAKAMKSGIELEGVTAFDAQLVEVCRNNPSWNLKISGNYVVNRADLLSVLCSDNWWREQANPEAVVAFFYTAMFQHPFDGWATIAEKQWMQANSVDGYEAISREGAVVCVKYNAVDNGCVKTLMVNAPSKTFKSQLNKALEKHRGITIAARDSSKMPSKIGKFNYVMIANDYGVRAYVVSPTKGTDDPTFAVRETALNYLRNGGTVEQLDEAVAQAKATMGK